MSCVQWNAIDYYPVNKNCFTSTCKFISELETLHRWGPACPTPIGADWGWACGEEEMVRCWSASLPQSGPIRARLAGGRDRRQLAGGLRLIGVRGPIGDGDGHGEGLWVVGQLALPPNEIRGANQGASSHGKESQVVGQWALALMGWRGGYWSMASQVEGLQEANKQGWGSQGKGL